MSYLRLFTKTTFRGIGQIMLQGNAATGLALLIGIFIGSFYMGAGALLAAAIGTATAEILKYDREEREQGLYGFSAALVGVAVFLFLKPVFISWIIVVLTSVLATALQHFFIRKKIAAFTLPFVLATWAIIFLVKRTMPDLLLELPALVPAAGDRYLFPFKGYGQVIFQEGLLPGIIFLFAVLISSPTAGLYGFVAALLSGLIGYCFVPFELIGVGLFSYNAILCAIVFAGRELKNVVWAAVSTLLSIVVWLIMAKYQWMILTFPFVLASFLTVFFQKKYKGGRA